MPRIKPLLVLCAALLTVTPAASADVNSDMNQFFNKLGFASNTTQPGVWQGQAAGYAYGGSLYARTQVKNVQLISMTLPDINAGCGGIDAYLGSFSFINSEQLQRFVKQIMSNAAGYFFDLALQTTVPEIKTAKDFLQKMASDINSMNLSSCQAAQGIIGGLFPRTQVSQQKVCQDIAGESNIFADWAASRQGCTVGGKSDSVRDKASDKDKERVTKNINIMWNALSKNRMFDGNKELKEFVMTLTGSLVFGPNGEITPLSARTTDRSIIRAMMEGGTAKIYHCNDSDKCLKVVADTPVTISRDNALKSQITKLLASIQNKAVSDTPLDDKEKGFISSTTIPVFKYLVDPQMLGVSNSMIYQLTDYIGYDILLQYIQELIQQARAMVATGNYDEAVIEHINDNMNDATRQIAAFQSQVQVTLLDGAARHNVQVLITDSGQRTGTGSALMAMKDAGVNSYRWQGGEQRPATIISEPDRNVRYARLAGDFAASVKAGEESVAQVSGVREQAILTQAIRSELKTQGVLGHPEVTMTALSPVWLDSRSRYLRDMYRPGMVMEQWNPETRSHDRYVIDRVTAQSHSLTLRDAQGETQVVRISSLDSSWSLFRPEKMPVADGERLRVTGKIPGLRVSGGDRLQVTSVSEDAMTVVVPGRAEPASLPVADSPFTALKLENGWVETPGHSVSDSATVFASVTQMAMDNATLNGLARSGRDVRLYSSLDETRTAEKLARHPSFTVVSEQIKARAGEILLETAISLQKAGLHTPAQQAIHLALPVLESKNLAFSMVDLLTEAKSFAAEGTSFTDLGGEINAQIKRGDLLYVDVAKGYGTGLLVSRASYEAEKSILRHILEGKEAVTPLMERVPGELMEKLTSGQRAATRMILETSDRFTVVQGYAGVGKTTQFRAVMSAVNMLPESGRPRVVGLGPTHRAVGEMRSAGVDAQTLASFLHDTQLQQRSGETPDFSNTLFLLDESSMVGNTDMARAYALIAAGGGRAVASGDTDQLQAIAPGQPFRLQQTRSAADVAIMKEIVRQTPELREAVYSLINRDVERALSGLESVKPSQVPRQEGAWAPEHSVTEFSHSQEAKLAEAQQKAMLKGEAFPDVPMTLYEAIVRDYTGRTPEAREQTLIVTHLNEDRRVLNSMIHDAREKAGELGKEQVMVPVLNTANIRDGELRRLSTWETHRDALVLVDNVYHRIAGISKDDGLITLQDAEGNTRLISPREAVAEGVTLYTPDTIRVGAGDRMRFTKSDRERGYVANSVWTVTAVSGDSVTLSGRQQTRVIRPAQERAEQHIDLAYAITAHGAQGASETFAIALEGTEGSRKLMAGFESAYVALSRMKQHVQVYTDNRQGWTDAINNAVQKGTAHDVFEPKPDREVMNAERLFSTARELRDVAAGRAVLRQAGLAGGDSPARFIAPGRKYPQPYVALPAFDRNGKSAGIWLNPLTTDDGNGLRGFSGEGRVKGSGDAQFVALQGSRNGESLLADNMQDGVRIARDNPDSGVVVRIAGEGRPWNPGAITGGRVWGDIPDNSVQPGAGNGEPVTAEVLAQRQAEEAIRRETVRRADEIVRKMAENKPDLPDSKTEQAVREIAGQERDRSAISEREAALPESVLRESQREREAVREIARENLLQERLQQMERDMVRDLQKEKTLGGD